MTNKDTERMNIWRDNNRERYNKNTRLSARRRSKAIHLEILQLLGNKCSNPNCPIPPEKMDIRCLQIDHINGGGTKERKQFSNYVVYKRYVLSQLKIGSKDYQLLCAYCNWLKRVKSKELPNRIP